jgi:hypothetical protein
MLFKDMKCLMCDGPAGPEAGGTSFIARGNYGSTIWDNVPDNECLSVEVCESCLRGAAARGRVTHNVTDYRPPNHFEETWTPDQAS